MLSELGERWKRLRARGETVRGLGTVLVVQRRYGEVHGGNLASAVAFQMFLSLLPLVLVAVAVIGYLSSGGTDIVGGIVREFGLSGDAASAVADAVEAAERSKRASTIVGLTLLFWSGLGLVGAAQYALNQVWQVDARGLKDKAVAMLWLAGVVVLFVASAAIVTAVAWLPGPLAPLAIAVSLAISVGLWWWTMKILPNIDVGWRDLLPGAIVGGIGLEALKIAGAYIVPRSVASSSNLYGTLGIVIAILGWLYLFGRLIVYAAVVDVVLYERRHGVIAKVVDVPAQPGASEDAGDKQAV